MQRNRTRDDNVIANEQQRSINAVDTRYERGLPCRAGCAHI